MQVVTEGELVAQERRVRGGGGGRRPRRAGGAVRGRARWPQPGEDAETWGFMRVLFCEEDGRRCAPLQGLWEHYSLFHLVTRDSG